MITIPEGLPVSIALANDPQQKWKPHTMRISISGERVAGESGTVVVRYKDWLILTRWARINAMQKAG